MMPIVAVLLLSALASPLAANRFERHSPDTSSLEACQTKSVKPSKATAKPGQKSVLDAEALESPISFFKDMLSSNEEEDNDKAAASPAGPALIAVKGLVATLLSTII